MRKLIIGIFILLSLSCNKNKEEEITINEELMTFVGTFVSEGEKRGLELSIDGLQANLLQEFIMDFDESVCGYGRYFDSDRQRLDILNTEHCWKNRSRLEQENLVYHELGHALLGRNHVNQTLPNEATQKSIMCTEVCNNLALYLKMAQ